MLTTIKNQTTKLKKRVSEVFYTICPVESTSHVALNKGFLNDAYNSIGIKLKHISSLPKVEWINHFTHTHPYFFRDGGNIPPIWTHSRGVDNIVIGATFPQRKQAIIVKRDSLINSIPDLRNKRIALPKREGALIDFWRATVHKGVICSLKANGLVKKDIRFVDITLKEYLAKNSKGGSIWSHKSDFQSFIKEEIIALEEGIVDAIYTEGARLGALEESMKYKIIYDLSSHPNLFYRVNICAPCVITVSKKLAENYPDIVVKYMEAVVKASVWAKSNREEVIEIFSKALYVPKEAIEKSFSDNFHQSLMPRLDSEVMKALEIEKDFLKDYGYIEKDFEISGWIDESFLKKALNLAR